MGDLVWKAPSKRASVKSESTGLDVEPEFEIKAGAQFLPIFLDALPRTGFFKNILVKESKRYARESTQVMSPHARRVDMSLFTVGNFMRLFACVIMRGLVQAKDDRDFFKTESHHKYVRTGGEEVCGLTLTQYQQLLRFMHLVDNRNQTRPSDANHDKCFKVRPLIR